MDFGLRKLFLNEQKVTTATGETTVEPVPAAVEAPAFSLTKVLAAGSVIITSIATLIVTTLDDADFELAPVHIVALAIGLMGFLAIASSADVLARAVATNKSAAADDAETDEERVAREAKEAENAAAAAKEKSEYRDKENLIPFKKVLSGTYTKEGEESPIDVTVLGATGGSTAYFLVKEGDGLFWLKAAQVTIQGVA